ncbi:hypothetical protein B0T11DRAFT_297072 [Plectosphaerella cucumerina]|uniref:Uncharacterized protein n=1 Tax=Plectosphaerella cucumerina TaxID=40658 RepID=A0A8K0TB82_9PEZI|nr:hypothetical protein B0T11DRAFT_297072 [Plectosphaerella cucumerina]
MPRYYTPSPSPSPDRHRAASRSRTTQRTRSRSRFSEVSSSSRGDNRRALDRPATRGSLRSRRHSDDSGSYRSGRSRSRSSSDSSRRHTRRNADRSRSRPPRSRSRDVKDAPTSSSKFIDKKDKIPLGFLAGIGVSAVLLHKFWPKGWLHGDEKYWDRLGRDKRDKVDDAVRVKRERAEAALRHGGESVREHVGPAYDGFREGYTADPGIFSSRRPTPATERGRRRRPAKKTGDAP